MNRFDYQAVIGLEVHVQLKTRTKIFCGCKTGFGSPPNTQVCPVCLGYPGVLPVMNEEVLRLAVKACLMLDFTINRFNKMDRKNYFYPDLPKNYQISQFDLPVGIDGKLTIPLENGPKTIAITRVHMEEDAGKLLHAAGGSRVDYNRTGVPLLEIVSEPEMNSSQEACLYLKKLKQLLEYADISDCNMEEGSLRCDANVSVRRRGETALGTKTEIKNVNSIKFIQKAIDYEIDRQVALLEEGGRVVQETRLFDSNSGKTRPMRSKEEAHDYRYFPEPDLVPVELSEEQIERIRAELPEKPDRMQQRFQEQYALPAYDALVLTADRFLAAYFERCLEIHANPKLVSNWIMGELIRELNAGNTTADRFPVSPEEFAGLLRMVDTGTISGNIAKSVFAKMIETGDSAATIVEREGLSMISDKSELDQLVRDVLDSNPSTVSDFKNGKKKALGFLVGQVMKASRGKADPRMVNTLLKKALT